MTKIYFITYFTIRLADPVPGYRSRAGAELGKDWPRPQNVHLKFTISEAQWTWGDFVMSTFLSKEVQLGLEAARKRELTQKSRLRVRFDGAVYPVLKYWETGFSVDADDAPQMRGLVDLFDGARHVSQCLIVASHEENGEFKFEFKRNTEAHDIAPVDFEKDLNAPIALIT